MMKFLENIKDRCEKIVNKKKEARRVEKANIENYNTLIANEKERIKQDEAYIPEEYIVLKDINKVYDNHVQAVFDFNIEIKKGEFIVFVGPSGCGKSTTLRMIAGLEDITTGDLFIDGVLSNYLKPVDRNVAMVFQNYALYPHLSVYENMAIGLKTKHISKEEIDRRIKEASKILELDDYLNRKPKALSGGQCQRVALGRAIVKEAKVFLMDEPLSNLDAKLRVQMRGEIIKLHKAINATTIYVTHDQVEAMTMADRIVVMNKGHIQQIGTPEEIYNNPKNLFVAGFMGSTAMNLIDCLLVNNFIKIGDTNIAVENFEINCKEYYERLIKKLENDLAKRDENNHLLCSLISKQKTIDKTIDTKQYDDVCKEIDECKKSDLLRRDIEEKISALKDELNKNEYKIVFGIRAEDVKLNTDITKYAKLRGIIENIELLGNEYHIHTRNAGQSVIFKVDTNNHFQIGQKIDFYCDLSKAHIFDGITMELIK